MFENVIYKEDVRELLEHLAFVGQQLKRIAEVVERIEEEEKLETERQQMKELWHIKDKS